MIIQKARILITNELLNLSVSPKCEAWSKVYDNALEASEIMNEKELKEFIQEWVDSFPARYFLV
jgi:hypothetical protein